MFDGQYNNTITMGSKTANPVFIEWPAGLVKGAGFFAEIPVAGKRRKAMYSSIVWKLLRKRNIMALHIAGCNRE